MPASIFSSVFYEKRSFVGKEYERIIRNRDCGSAMCRVEDKGIFELIAD